MRNYNMKGEEISLEDAALLFEDPMQRIVGLTAVGEVKVSTVLLVIDHGHGAGPPLIFETLVFGGDRDGEMDRYHTLTEAQLGHLEMVKRVFELHDGR
jgi:hypothetical protein